jgi:hypothetical protein
MSLQFIGDAGIYLPERDAVKITAVAGDSVVDCYVTRSGLDALGCSKSGDALNIVNAFEARRLDCEIAALVKFRRATAKLLSLEITAADIALVDARPHAA